MHFQTEQKAQTMIEVQDDGSGMDEETVKSLIFSFRTVIVYFLLISMICVLISIEFLSIQYWR